ncbi:MAG TPA: hypothetical protein VF741_10260 [Candidatus Aquilonibacter sp.]
MTRFALLVLVALTACTRQLTTASAYQYPDNSTLPASSFVGAATVVRSLHIKDASNIVVRRAPSGGMLLRWSQVVTPEIALKTVAPGRMVYEITAIHTRPFTVGPSNYRSGRQTTIVDAQTGAWLITTARGALASRTMRTP